MRPSFVRHARRAARASRDPHPAPASRVSNPTTRARRGVAIQDRALYSCVCGYAWEADVTASVGCPHCGTSQAW